MLLFNGFERIDGCGGVVFNGEGQKVEWNGRECRFSE